MLKCPHGVISSYDPALGAFAASSTQNTFTIQGITKLKVWTVYRIHSTSVTTAMRSQRNRCSIPTLKSSHMAAVAVYPGKVGIDPIIQADLAVLLECVCYGGNQHRFIIAFRDMALAHESDDGPWKSAQCFNHVALISRVQHASPDLPTHGPTSKAAAA